jgi:hypothetical protein
MLVFYTPKTVSFLVQDMKNNIVNVIPMFFKELAVFLLYYVLPLIALTLEILLLSFLLDVFIGSARHSYVWLTVIDMVGLYLIPWLFYKTFLKMWDGAKKTLNTGDLSEIEVIEYSYLIAWLPSLMLALLVGATFFKELLDLPGTSIDTPQMVASMIGFVLSMVFVFDLLAFGRKQFRQLINKCKNG